MKFDSPIRVGEIRLLADFPEPRLVLVLAEHGNFAYRVVPLSSCTSPASSREYEWKGRVYQLWQTQPLAKAVLARSWLVERLAPEDFAEIVRAQSADRPAPLRPVERAQVVSFASIRSTVGTIPQGVHCRAKRRSGRPRTLTPRHWFLHRPWPSAARPAASILIALGLAALVYPFAHRFTSNSSLDLPPAAPVLTVHLTKEPTPIEPLEEPTEVLADESELALVPVEITLPTLAFEISTPEAEPQVSPLAEPIRLPGLPKIRGLAQAPAKSGARKETDSVKKGTGPSEFVAQRAETFDWLLKRQDSDGSWGQSLRGTALAVIALLADQQTGTGPARRMAVVAGVRYLTEQKEFAADRQTAQLLACALSGGWVVTRNPNVKLAAERAIAAANSHLSVEAARDWTGLLVDLTPTVVEPKSGHVAAPRPEDELTAACLYLLQTANVE